MTQAACSHLLARDGVCRCGWTATPVPPPAYATPGEPEPDSVRTECWRCGAEPMPGGECCQVCELLQLRADRARDSLAWFVRESWHVLEESTLLEWGWHIEAICDHLQWIAEEWMWAKRNGPGGQRVQNAYFSLPPGVLKTRLIVECLPAWMWLKWPSWTVTCLSVNPERARDSARNARKIITSDWYQTWFRPTWQLRDDQDAVGDFGNTAGGHRKSKGITAQIIGARTDWLLIDDPNDPEDDEDQFAKINKRWDSTLWSRVNDLRIAVRIIVQQRLALEDLTGHVSKKPGWMGFVMPLLFDPERRCRTLYGWTDPRQAKDEPLHPARFTPEVIHELRVNVYGERMFQAQCQQAPDSADGEIFKVAWWGFWRRSDHQLPEGWRRPQEWRQDEALVVNVDRRSGALAVDDVCVTVDATGGSTEADASHVGILVCSRVGGRRLVLDDLGAGPRSWSQMKTDLDIAIPHAANISGKRLVHLLVEKKALGPALTAEIEARVKAEPYTASDGTTISVIVEDYEPSNSQASKVARAQALEVPMSLAEILVPEDAPWLPRFMAEFKRFPKKPNDRVDALAQYVDRYRKKKTWADAFKAAGR